MGIDSRDLLLTVPEAGIPRSGHRHGWVLRAPVLSADGCPLVVSSHGGEQRKLWSLHPHMKAPVPLWGSTSMT